MGELFVKFFVVLEEEEKFSGVVADLCDFFPNAILHFE